MAACRSDLQRPLDGRLSLDVGEIFGGSIRLLREAGRGRRRCDLPVAAQVLDDLAERGCADHLQPLDYGRFAGVVVWNDQPPQSLLAGFDGHREYAAHRFERPVERQFARQHRSVERFGRHLLRGGQNAHGDRQIEARSLLTQVGRSEVDHQFLARHPQSRVFESRTDALLALLDGVVGQPDQKKSQLSCRGDVHLDRDRYGVDACDGSCCGTDEHGLRRVLRR